MEGSVAYIPQSAWIPNESLKNVILFGRSLDQVKYDTTIEACGLTKVCMCLFECIYVYMNCIDEHFYVYMYTHIHIHMYIYIVKYDTAIEACGLTKVFIYIYMYLYIYIYIHIYIYV
jgi:hypothetical protein